MKLYEKIAVERKKCGLSQETLAEKIGVSRQAVSKWETGDALPEITKLKALAECFGVTVDYLLDEEADEYKAPTVEHNRYSGGGFDRFIDWCGTLPEKAIPFLQKYGWVGGILLILFGIATITRGVMLFAPALQITSIAMSGVTIPYLIFAACYITFGAVAIAGGIIIIKKFKK